MRPTFSVDTNVRSSCGHKTRPFICLILSILFFLPLAGCFSVSDEELKQIKDETEALATELDNTRRKAEILDRSLTNVYKERDRLVDLLNDRNQPDADTEVASEQPVERPKFYVAKRGDTLSTIAQSHNTTVQAILNLNPYLAGRSNHMVWENDRITMP